MAHLTTACMKHNPHPRLDCPDCNTQAAGWFKSTREALDRRDAGTAYDPYNHVGKNTFEPYRRRTPMVDVVGFRQRLAAAVAAFRQRA
jgi:hypothetical protein